MKTIKLNFLLILKGEFQAYSSNLSGKSRVNKYLEKTFVASCQSSQNIKTRAWALRDRTHAQRGEGQSELHNSRKILCH